MELARHADHTRNHAAFWDGRDLTLTPASDLDPQPRDTGDTTDCCGTRTSATVHRRFCPPRGSSAGAPAARRDPGRWSGPPVPDQPPVLSGASDRCHGAEWLDDPVISGLVCQIDAGAHRDPDGL